jgi:hypothetical protein
MSGDALFFDDNEAKCDVIKTNGLVYELPPRYVPGWGNDAAFCGHGGGSRSLAYKQTLHRTVTAG